MPVPRLGAGLAGRLKQGRSFPLQIAALEIAGLSKVNAHTPACMAVGKLTLLTG